MNSRLFASKRDFLARLAREGADEPDAREVLLRLGGDLAEELLDRREAPVRGLAHDLRRDRDDRQHRERDERQRRATPRT